MTNQQNSTSPTPDSGMPTAGKVALLAGVAAVVGSFMSWSSIVSVFGSIELSGIRGDGKITAAVAVLAVLFGYGALSTRTRSNATLATLLAIGGLAIAVYDWNHLQRVTAAANSEYLRASVGNGLYLVVGGFVVFLCGLWTAMPRDETSWQVALRPPTGA